MTLSTATARSTTASTLTSRWHQFWFAPMAAFNFALFRTGLGLITFLWFATLAPDVETFFGDGSLALGPVPGKGTLNLFNLTNSDYYVWAGLAVGIVSSLTLIVGRLTRVGGPVLAVLLASTMAENRMLWNAGDDLLQTFCLLFGLFCLLTPSAALDVPLTASARTSSSLATAPIWFFQLVRIQMTVVYLVAFLAKVPGDMWRDGTASMAVLRVESLSRFYTPALFETNFLIGNVITWATLILEGVLPFLLWNQRARPYAIAAAVVFHAAIDWALTIGFFSWIMILGLTTFLAPDFRSRLQQTEGWARTVVPAPARFWWRPGRSL